MNNRKYIKAAIHVTRRKLAAYLPILDVSRPFAMLLHGSRSQRRWETHVVEGAKNNWRYKAEEIGINIESVQRQPLQCKVCSRNNRGGDISSSLPLPLLLGSSTWQRSFRRPPRHLSDPAIRALAAPSKRSRRVRVSIRVSI